VPDSPTDGRLGVRVTFLGHATALIEMDGTRLLTDPVLRGRVAHLRREGRIDRDSVTNVDGVLISHAHMDNLDRPSLATIDPRALMIAPAAAARLLVKRPVIQVSEGSRVEVGSLTVEVTHADHDGRRFPIGRPLPAVGYRIRGTSSVYFAGDTGLFDDMAEIGRAGVDVALLPVSGWGPRLPPQHLNALEAAQALRLLTPKVAIPIHWGTLHTPMRRSRTAEQDAAAPQEFARFAAEIAPEVRIEIVPPGSTVDL
jgi:L-ascorbate metabolism protein UlaG (beta-lactamase superfamily)